MQSQARTRFAFLTLLSMLTILSRAQTTPIPPNTRLLTTSIRTGDTDVFWVNPVTEDAYWRSIPARDKAYQDKRPVWIIGADGSNPHVVETLRYQCH